MVMGEIRSEPEKTKTEGNNDNWKLEKTETEEIAVKQLIFGEDMDSDKSGTLFFLRHSVDINVMKYGLVKHVTHDGS